MSLFFRAVGAANIIDGLLGGESYSVNERFQIGNGSSDQYPFGGTE